MWIAVSLGLGSVTASADVIKKAYGDLFMYFKYHLKGEGDTVYLGKGVAVKIMTRESPVIGCRRCNAHHRQKARRRARRIAMRDMIKTYNGKLAAQARIFCGGEFASHDPRLMNFEDADWIEIYGAKVFVVDEDHVAHRTKKITPGKGRFRCENGRAIHVLPHNTHRRNGPPVVHGDGGSATGGRAAPPPPPSLRRGRAAPPPPPSLRRDGGSGR